MLVRDPGRFDVLVTTNMFGDILSDLAAELSGSLGLAGSLNVGRQHVAAQAQHGSALDIAGHDRANPVSLICRGNAACSSWRHAQLQRSMMLLMRHSGMLQAEQLMLVVILDAVILRRIFAHSFAERFNHDTDGDPLSCAAGHHVAPI